MDLLDGFVICKCILLYLSVMGFTYILNTPSKNPSSVCSEPLHGLLGGFCTGKTAEVLSECYLKIC